MSNRCKYCGAPSKMGKLQKEKATLEKKIKEAKTKEELNAIAFEFSMTDFTTPIE